MKEKIHPNYKIIDVTCACGATFQTGTTKKADVLKVEICSQCHPFYSGKQKIIDTGGRVDKFRKRFGEAGLK
ncbi:MAG: 50S ribosomal protein L31 [Clostridia bacterium]|nr:50S ribosomal protein L31 [Clostridia bacterium]